MRYTIITDKRGYKRRVMLRDTDGDEMAEYGIPAGPPNLDGIDWEYVKRDINDTLVKHGLFTWQDVLDSSVGLNAVVNVVKRHIKGLYQEQANIDKQIKDK